MGWGLTEIIDIYKFLQVPTIILHFLDVGQPSLLEKYKRLNKATMLMHIKLYGTYVNYRHSAHSLAPVICMHLTT